NVHDGNKFIHAFIRNGTHSVAKICALQTGPEGLTPELMGVNYRALNDLFDFQQYRKNMIAYEVHVQMLEICKNKSKDLLITDGSVTKYPLL
nr:kinesin-like protein KIN-14O isoform X1 [Tanacetum cinerariifolium]